MIDWILKNADKADAVRNEKMMCLNYFIGFKNAAAAQNMKKFKDSKDELIKLKKDGVQVKEILKDFNNELAGAYYFGINNTSEEKIQKKFGMSSEHAISKINKMIENCQQND